MQFEADNIVSINGICLRYVDVGAGKPVILVHGNGETHDLFDTEIEQLVSAGYHVYAPDSRGHGASEHVEEYHYDDMAEDIYEFIRVLSLESPAYYGHSDGGIIGLLLELHHPGTLGLLAISGTNLHPSGIEASCLQAMSELNKTAPNPLLTLMLTEPDINPEQLQKISLPVLVTAGEQDLILPSETEKIVEHLPNAALVLVEGADHGSYIDGSEIMGNLLLDFLKENEY